MSFSEKLYMLRTVKGISQKELADTLGVAQSSINYWEKGQRDPSISIVEKIADYFGISVDEMIGWDENKTIEENITNSTIAAEMLYDIIKKGFEGKVYQISFNTNDYSPEELLKILEYAEFIKSKRK